MALTLPPTHRIRHKVDFDQVFKQRKRLYGRCFLAYYHPNQLSHPRIGVIASKRSLRLAVDRNRVRRVLKEQFRGQQHELINWDIVFIAQRGLKNVENKELRQCCDELLKKLRTLHKKG